MTVAPLERLAAFVNTFDLMDGSDAIATPDHLRTWLAEHDLGRTSPSGADVERASTLREAVRDHLLANGGGELRPGAVAVLDGQAARSGLTVGFAEHGSVLQPTAAGVDGALGVLLADVAAAMADGTWASLKACRADDCRWAFVDRSRNGSRHWCAMGVCGNRAKARRYRARRRTP